MKSTDQPETKVMNLFHFGWPPPPQSLKVPNYDDNARAQAYIFKMYCICSYWAHKNKDPFEAISEVLWFHSFYGSKLVSL